MSITVREIELRVVNMQTRMPFRYGIASMTALPHLFVRCQLEVNGVIHAGTAADGLPPKWFTKDPHTTFAQDLADMLRVIETACALALHAGPVDSVFDLWHRVYQAPASGLAPGGVPPLLWSFGASLVERAALDAFCRATRTTFADALHRNTVGIDLEQIHPELAGYAPADLLPAQPLRTLIARHTVGLSDPLTDADIPAEERLDDGLPQSLEACIHAYGLTHFKLKLCGDADQDWVRLERIAGLLTAHAPGSYAFTLDGNEQFSALEPFQAFWQSLMADAALAPFLDHLLFVEQPLHRDMALRPETCRALAAWKERPPMIIDESDGELRSLPTALEGGYVGTSHKNCKGVFKGIANACLIAFRRREHPEGGFVLSGEDLANIGPVALLQDLAVMASLGVTHVERNGHHYFTGLSMLPWDLQARILLTHPDLYRHQRLGPRRGFATLDIRNGVLSVDSVVNAPFGLSFDLDLGWTQPLSEWTPASLSSQ